MTPYTLPEPFLTLQGKSKGKLTGEVMNLFDGPAMSRAYADGFAAGAASRDAEIAHLKQELQIECASNAIKDTDTAALRADALRYRWLRDHVIFGYPSSEGSSNKAAYLVVTGYGYRERKNLTDQAVDAASAAEATK